MPAKLLKLSGAPRIPLGALLAGLALSVSLTACAPDMFQLGRSTELDAYLNRIAKNCGQTHFIA